MDVGFVYPTRMLNYFEISGLVDRFNEPFMAAARQPFNYAS